MTIEWRLERIPLTVPGVAWPGFLADATIETLGNPEAATAGVNSGKPIQRLQVD